jgi:HSP20 family protein
MPFFRLDDPIGSLLGLQEELERFRRNPEWSTGLSGFGAFPPVNIFDSQAGAMIIAEIPGVEPSTINVSGKSRTITISGVRHFEPNGNGRGYHRRELNEGQFSRSLQLPDDYDVNQAQARYEAGLLMIAVPRAEHAKERQITIQSA